MQSAEIELKFHIDSLPEFERNLPELGFRLVTPRTFEQNTLYDTPERTLRNRGEILRVRRYGDRWVLTHKRHPDDEDTSSIYKVRIETESEISDGEVLAEVFTRLGYGPAFRYEKYRTEYESFIRTDAGDAHGHLVLDETPIGIFGELEGPTDWIDRSLAALGIDARECLTESYGKLFLRWKAETGSAAENLVFDEVEAAELVAR